ncbi:hypothetical protein ZWY2020_050171 [Hordeum vulgare]|nr:hypothetical protein ZWY2020_050171 [Hordeum vulgare]
MAWRGPMAKTSRIRGAMCASADRSSDAAVLNMSARALQLWPCSGHGNTRTCAGAISVAPPVASSHRLGFYGQIYFIFFLKAMLVFLFLKIYILGPV